MKSQNNFVHTNRPNLKRLPKEDHPMDKILNVLLFFTLLVVVVVVSCGIYHAPVDPNSSLCVEECYRGKLYLVCPDSGVVQMLEENGEGLFLVKCDEDNN